MDTHDLNGQNLEVFSIKNLPNFGGIYYLLNLTDNKIYVGSSRCIRKRIKSHIRALFKQKHENTYLQNAWNKYGPTTFIYGVLENCSDVKYLTTFEQFWIESLQSYLPEFGYNLARQAVNPPIPSIKKTRYSKITEERALEIKKYCINSGLSPLAISKALQESERIVSSIYYGRAWKHLLPEVKMPLKLIMTKVTPEIIQKVKLAASNTTYSMSKLTQELGMKQYLVLKIIHKECSQEVIDRLKNNAKVAKHKRWTDEQKENLGKIRRQKKNKMTAHTKAALKEANKLKVKELRSAHKYDPKIISSLKAELLIDRTIPYKLLSDKYNIPTDYVCSIATNRYWAHLEPILETKFIRPRISEEIKRAIKTDLTSGLLMNKEVAAKYNVGISSVEVLKKELKSPVF